jgi:hypothetical protein
MHVHGQLSPRASADCISELPMASWQCCQRLAQLAQLSANRGWSAAASSSREQLRWALQDVRRQLDAQLAKLSRPPTPIACSPRDILEDLIVLKEEFEDVKVDLREGSVAVVTEPIVLEGIDLGRFEVILPWQGMATRWVPYSVVALDPRPATVNSAVTHPHVQDERLCEGEGAAAVRAALASGRLLDFFTVVAQILATYNAGSAYVALESWFGTPCADCGDSVDDDHGSVCEHCEAEVCDNCSSSCPSCDRYFCSSCVGSCRGCSESACHLCLETWIGCHHNYCRRCLLDEQCRTCREAQDEESGGDPVASGPADALRVG